MDFPENPIKSEMWPSSSDEEGTFYNLTPEEEGLGSSGEKMTPPQPEHGRSCTIDEFLAQMEPQFQADKNTIRQCIAGLTEHAAQLAAKHQDEQIPRLRKLCIELGEFWGLAEDETWAGFQKMVEEYGGAFDRAVSSAQESGYAPETSEQTRLNILNGLALYAREMSFDSDLESWVAECEALSEQLQAEWQTEVQINMEMGGM